MWFKGNVSSFRGIGVSGICGFQRDVVFLVGEGGSGFRVLGLGFRA